jgi:hypothetical protein
MFITSDKVGVHPCGRGSLFDRDRVRRAKASRAARWFVLGSWRILIENQHEAVVILLVKHRRGSRHAVAGADAFLKVNDYAHRWTSLHSAPAVDPGGLVTATNQRIPSCA